MPRSYQFDHFTGGQPEPSHRAQAGDREKQKLTQPQEQREPEQGPRYGRRFAQTQSRYQGHAREPKRPRPRTLPIGALPAPDLLLEAPTARDALELAARQVRSMVLLARELAASGIRLLALPFELARIAAERLRAPKTT